MVQLALVIAASLALAVSFSAWADFTGKVVGVADGDSITVLRDREQVKVRLVEIDAPEKGQAFGNRSKQALEALVKGQDGTGGGARRGPIPPDSRQDLSR